MQLAAGPHSLTTLFADAMLRLGPVGRLALAVSGGADSMALAVLARDWAPARAELAALVVDHGLRAGSGAEAAQTVARLTALGIPARVLALDLPPGPAVQARARAARHAALAAAARAAGFLHLALGHHAADQAETLAMRAARGTGGAEGIAAWSARRDVILLRPLLRAQPGALRALLRERGVTWVEDPSNADVRFERARLRAAGVFPAAADATARLAADRQVAAFLARHAVLRPEGFAILATEEAPAAALAALIRVVGGRDYAPSRAAIAKLTRLRPATLGGVQIALSRAGWLLAREPAACAPPMPALPGALWDRRFRLDEAAPPGAMLGAAGHAPPSTSPRTDLPALVRRGLPCLRLPDGGVQWPAASFTPPAPLSSHPFLA